MGYRHKMGADKAFAMGRSGLDRAGRPIHWTPLPQRGNAPPAGSMLELQRASRRSSRLPPPYHSPTIHACMNRPAAVQNRPRLDLLDPFEVSKLGGLEVITEGVVEGFLSGLHRSPRRGFSVEFAAATRTRLPSCVGPMSLPETPAEIAEAASEIRNRQSRGSAAADFSLNRYARSANDDAGDRRFEVEIAIVELHLLAGSEFDAIETAASLPSLSRNVLPSVRVTAWAVASTDAILPLTSAAAAAGMPARIIAAAIINFRASVSRCVTGSPRRRRRVFRRRA